MTQRFALTLPASILPARDFFTTQSANAMKKATHRSDKLGLSLDGFETTQDRYIFSRDSISLICRFGTNGEWVDWVQVERAGCNPCGRGECDGSAWGIVSPLGSSNSGGAGLTRNPCGGLPERSPGTPAVRWNPLTCYVGSVWTDLGLNLRATRCG